MEWEEAHSLAERAVWKDILEERKGKNCYGSTLVLTWQGTGLGKQKSNIVKKTQKTKDSIRNWEQLRRQHRDKTSWRETLHCHRAWNCSHSVRKQGRNKIWALFSNCKTKKKKLDKHANKTRRATTRLVLTLLNTKTTNNVFPIKHTWKGDRGNGIEIIAGEVQRGKQKFSKKLNLVWICIFLNYALKKWKISALSFHTEWCYVGGRSMARKGCTGTWLGYQQNQPF